ncbi:type I-F CRISPR-associated endonuclease Cas1f [Succinimonas amylolytica]|uniref:type I-F CRISPR-associated endonuclease Cas1f n=1 Tax=Succinimonas amylolytica TaxID=83769 RepID=UPI0003715CDF|nr:type I-F CRISPR-associated endonuclease Cas1f [Succinimonas amylolytica]
MDGFKSSEMKSILHSKRSNIYFLEHCRVMQKDGRVLYLTEDSKQESYFNIPICNTIVILLGSGTSITQAAARMLAQAGVLFGFCGGGGTPLFDGNSIEFVTPQSEYRPPLFVQQWLSFWYIDEFRLKAAKQLQRYRISFIKKIWSSNRDLNQFGLSISDELYSALNDYSSQNDNASNVTNLLTIEARFTKLLYKYAATTLLKSEFSRSKEGESTDLANSFLDHGNYLAYGLAASVLWVLGIPHAFALMHGKTRRGALVFDVADIIKDAVVLPWAFICAARNYQDSTFRKQLIVVFNELKVMDYMFDSVQQICSDNNQMET